MILRATAEKESRIAKAEAITYINDTKPDSSYITLQGFKALEEVAKGEATKIIIPSVLQGMASLSTSLSLIVKTKK